MSQTDLGQSFSKAVNLPNGLAALACNQAHSDREALANRKEQKQPIPKGFQLEEDVKQFHKLLKTMNEGRESSAKRLEAVRRLQADRMRFKKVIDKMAASPKRRTIDMPKATSPKATSGGVQKKEKKSRHIRFPE